MRQHAVMMHGITQLAFFGNNSMLRSCFRYAAKYFVLVRINGPLPGGKADQQNPGANNMAFISFHDKMPYGIFCKPFAKIIKYSYIIVTISL